MTVPVRKASMVNMSIYQCLLSKVHPCIDMCLQMPMSSHGVVMSIKLQGCECSSPKSQQDVEQAILCPHVACGGRDPAWLRSSECLVSSLCILLTLGFDCISVFASLFGLPEFERDRRARCKQSQGFWDKQQGRLIRRQPRARTCRACWDLPAGLPHAQVRPSTRWRQW